MSLGKRDADFTECLTAFPFTFSKRNLYFLDFLDIISKEEGERYDFIFWSDTKTE